MRWYPRVIFYLANFSSREILIIIVVVVVMICYVYPFLKSHYIYIYRERERAIEVFSLFMGWGFFSVYHTLFFPY